jgi:hypothetical protein
MVQTKKHTSDAAHTAQHENDETPTDKPLPKRRPYKQWIMRTLAGVVALILCGVGLAYVASPAVIRSPRLEHAHVRMQVIVDGRAVNFGDSTFQIAKGDAGCTTDIPDRPIHFHDNKDQFVHLHWKGMTGGLILKNYGWNEIGGLDGTLGYRFDHLPYPRRLPTYGNVLPAMPKDAQLWVYSGDEKGYTWRLTDDFLKQDVETFFHKKSKVNASEQSSLLERLFFAKAAAHGTGSHDAQGNHAEGHAESNEQRLERINNLLGNVVIFAQKDKPTAEQVESRFQQLTPLSDSTCGG